MSKIVLPMEKVKASAVDPKLLVIYSKPKTGKTSLFAQLNKSIILDFEQGTDYVDAVKYNIDSLNTLKEVLKAIKETGNPYKYGIIDTITKLEDMAKIVALSMYQDTPIGKNFKGDDILTLPQGGGYYWLRLAFFRILDSIMEVFPYVILSAHLKEKLIETKGGETSALDLDLTGKLKSLVSSTADAIGFMYRKNNTNILTFKTKDEVICGARPEHLSNQEFVISEKLESGEIVSYWDKVFIS